ncbi:hypothetical protein [Clostridium estertheticum]|uniref:Dipeptidylpeptidase IV N-terminal domain-containing protein n=1 Tax=Clostridium estertheticum TaxID=238834 RepID=A0A7Y3WU47_9CLOT|nr:hypothetical protein [Clostridium estertheticum]MBW9172661.1 hypothetical protein [Clostridium estertheticum]NNU77776.1 hypothetical protein [Clostridium estertheticum]WBL45521.1 hypothetical protein LOR37_12520 [Clostridium estertheticum]WLC73596.1 hypothetical protein KTC99_12400 [Clostridium estertheticum]
MKKVFKKMIILIIISLIVQSGGLFYLNNYFLTSNSALKSQKVGDSAQNKKTSVSTFKVPSDATAIEVSYDAGYISYYLNNQLYVVNTITSKSVNVSSSNGVKISFCKWLPDRNRMLVVETQNRNLSLSYYDVTQSQKSKVSDILMISSASTVKDIEVSPLTNVIYIKVKNGYKNYSIYWVNIMKSRKKIVTKSEYVGNIGVIPHEDKMVYENLTNNKVYATGPDHALNFSGSTKSCLLAIDNNDQVYVGNVNSSNKIDKIYYGKLGGEWKSLPLSAAVSKDNLFVTGSGKVYKNDKIKSMVTEIQTNKETTYKGTFLQSYSTGVASLSDGNLVKTPFN